jgi:GT2 family glycosyltransferase
MTDEPRETAPSVPTPVGEAGGVVAVIPAWNRPRDLTRLLGDLARIDCPVPMGILVIDNGSTLALGDTPAVREALAAVPAGRGAAIHRLPENLGGSGGFNEGMRRALAGDDPEWLWLIDSDARVLPGTLAALLAVGQQRRDAPAVGAAIADPASGRVFEVGARLDRRTGRLVGLAPSATDPVEVDYAAACCLLVRADAVRRAGLMPDLFLHSDDVSFCLRLRRATGAPVLATARARCVHPRFDRYKSWARYYEARNWIVPCVDARLGAVARLRRAWREAVLAVGQTLIGRDDLARLHTRGLADAAAGRVAGRAGAERVRTDRAWPLHTLGRTIAAIAPTVPASAQPIAAVHADVPLDAKWRAALGKLLAAQGLGVTDVPPRPSRSGGEAIRGLLRLLFTPPAGIAVVNASAKPHAWCAGRIILSVSPEGYTVARLRVLERAAALAGVLWRCGLSSLRLALAPPRAPDSPAADAPPPEAAPPTLSIIILTRDRREMLLHTLERLEADETARQAEIIVVDNGSADGTIEAVRERFPRVTLVPTGANLGVEGFNRGVAASSGRAVLILDDDAWPADGSLAGALELLRERPGVAGVMLHRRHPRTERWEWPFAASVPDTGRWPDMGSGNVLRREAWDAVGGYEAGFFLYRNDTDLALKLLAAGREVVFTPGLHVWHDSPIAGRKTPAWLTRSTRNWIWLCKRHGRRGSGLLAGAMGWAWAHRLARVSPAGHAAVLRGVAMGVFGRAPALPEGVRPDGAALRRLVHLKRSLRA